MTPSFTLYRFYAADDSLLYIGRTINPGKRMEKHRATQPWWSDVARIEMEQLPNLETLMVAEREAIETEKPLHNIRMNGTMRRADASIVWTCEICRLPIEDEEGYLTVDYEKLHAYTAAVSAHDTRMEAAHPEWSGKRFKTFTLGELYDYPDRVEWHTYHLRCDPDPETNDYWIGIERIRTLGQALGWASHLSEKVWLNDTNWSAILRRLASESGVGAV
jgi:predicted GIY-YIG superfamily endonuclease